jgi:hypothetical protein
MRDSKALLQSLDKVRVPELRGRPRRPTLAGVPDATERRRIPAAVAGLVVFALASVLLWQAFGPAGQSARLAANSSLANHSAVDQAIQETITLGSPPGTVTFSPPPDGTTPAMSSGEAIAAFQSVDPEFQLPPDAVTYLGLYTAETGGGGARFLNQLAWGVRFHRCEALHHQVPSATPVSCTEWLFLDANTGAMLETQWQQG